MTRILKACRIYENCVDERSKNDEKLYIKNTFIEVDWISMALKSQKGISMVGYDAMIQLAVIQKETVQLNVSWAKY